VITQLIAAGSAAAFAFVGGLVLSGLVSATVGFTTDDESETIGLDRTEHGEVGFDLGLAPEMVPEASAEPRAASVPPNGEKRFTVAVEGANEAELIKVWSELCQASAAPPDPAFKDVYPYVTTVQGNRFRFRGGDQAVIRDSLQRLFEKRLRSPISTQVLN
jgi:hypothetical protein